MLNLPTPDLAAGLTHIERLSKLHLSTVLAEGITEPLAILKRMVELDNALIARQLESLAALDQHLTHSASREPSYAAQRGQAIVEYIGQSVYRECRA